MQNIMKRLPMTELAEQSLTAAREIAADFGAVDADSIFLMMGLLETRQSVAYEVLQMHGVTVDMFETKALELKTQGAGSKKKREFTPRAQEILYISEQLAAKYGSESIGTEFILLAFFYDGESEAVEILEEQKISIDGIFTDILVTIGIDYKTAKNELGALMNGDRSVFGMEDESIMEKYSTDLTKKAEEGKLDPVIGRKPEMERLMQVLCRRTKNNPCLVGDPGVGKTAMVEGLAQKIASGEVPDLLKGKRILSLDLTRVIAGTKYRGEFEERMKQIVQEVIRQKTMILFIDEIHTMIGAGASEGAMDASNILKPSLARGEFQMIGATTNDEYAKYFEKDAALERRFQPIQIDETSREETFEILEGLKYKFEEHHQAVIPSDVTQCAVELSDRYIGERFLPDKAIDLIDEACAKKRIELVRSSKKLSERKQYLTNLELEIEDQMQKGDMTVAGELHRRREQEEKKIRQSEIRSKKQKDKKISLTKEDIETIIALWTKIPVSQLGQDEKKRLLNLEKTLHAHVIGQDEAVTAVAKAIKRSRVGLSDPKRPIGSFLFLGPTGVGKTQLSKSLAQALFGREEDLIRIDMSEYMEKHSVSKIIGSPPGYVGFSEGGQLSERIRKHPYAVVLFDEIEKAHPDVFNILLQVLDDGHITDSQGRKVDFKNTVLIMTSNAGAGRIISPKQMGFSTHEDKAANHKKMTSGVMEEVRQIFRPEFLNRIDETIVFTILTKDEVKDISKLFLKSVKEQLKAQHQIVLSVSAGALDHLVEKGYDEKFGARPLRRLIQNEIEDVLSDMILAGTLKEGDKITVKSKNKKLDFSVAGAGK